MNQSIQSTSRRRALKLAGILLADFTLLSRTSQARTWTDNQGRTIEADLVEIRNGGSVVRLRKTDGMNSGKLFDIPVSSLSQADQRYIANFGDGPGGDPQDPDAGEKAAIRRRIKRLEASLRRAKQKGDRRSARRIRSLIARLRRKLKAL